MTRQNLPRRRLLLAVAGVCGANLAGVSLRAMAKESYPSRPINLVVGFAAGGQSDILARKVATELGKELAQPVVVQNKEGATSTIASRFVATSKPDGYTLLCGGGSGMVMAPLVMKVSFDPIKDFSSIAMLTTAALSISVHPSVPAKNLKELVELIKKDPTKYSYAHSGFGGSDHMTGELFKQVAGNLSLLHVPYKGAAPAIQDVIGGQVPILISTFSSVYPYHKTGQVRMLAMTSAKRHPSAPEMPTAAEQGYPGLVAETYNFLTVPVGTPEDVMATLRAATTRIMARPEFIADLKAAQFDPVSNSTPQSTDAFLAAEVTKWRKVAEQANITPQ